MTEAGARPVQVLGAGEPALEFLRLVQDRLPGQFAALAARLEADVRLTPEAKERMRARVLALAEEG